jgi:hypothetical protein
VVAAIPTVVQTVTNSLVVGALIALGVFNGLGLLMQATAFRSLRNTYRRHKSLELEQLQAQVVNQRKAEVQRLLEEDRWQQVLNQLLADALAGPSAFVGQEGILTLSADPAPRFAVAGPSAVVEYVFTTQPQEQGSGLWQRLRRREPVIPLDAALHPAARVEMQAVWEHLAEKRLRDEAPASPRQAEWFLVERRRESEAKEK